MGDAIMNTSNGMLFAPYARLTDGWRRNVLLQWDVAGILIAVTPDSTAPRGAPRARGPVLAGMPNLHSHAFQRAMAGLTEYRATAADSFWSWRDLMYRFAARITPDDMGAIARWLYIEMLKAGYTSVCEFHYIHHAPDGSRYANPAEMAGRIIDAAQSAGIGITMLPVLYQYSNFDAHAPQPDQRRFVNTPQELLDILAKLRSSRAESSALRYGIAPHSLRAVSMSSLRTLLAGLDADFPGAPIHIHIAEQTAEVDACVKSTGARPIRWLLDHFEVNKRWCLVHATHIDENEVTTMASSGAIAGLCLSTEANLGDGIFPAHDYLKAQGQFGIGSDSHIAIDWRSELRLLEYGQRLQLRQRNVLVSDHYPQVADRLFDGALAGGSLATGRSIGALEVGCRADWMVLDPEHSAIAEHSPDAWLSGIVFCEHGNSPVLDVTVGGQQVIKSRQHRDDEIAFGRYRATIASLLK